MRIFTGVILLTLSTTSAFADCGTLNAPTDQQLSSKAYQLQYRMEPDGLAVSQDFSVLFEVCKSDGTAVEGTPSVDAYMPMHGHGMNYRAQVEKLGDGKFRATGFMFHMPGKWQFKFDINEPQGSEQLTADHMVK
ncbi:MAG: FixH family protein [Rhodospirillales bacterium]|nr:FixH family protein [Rhodospirillales bacterium]